LHVLYIVDFCAGCFARKEFLEAVQQPYLVGVAQGPDRFLLIDAVQVPETILAFAEKSIRQKYSTLTA
jgi:hypothetical protein